MHYLYEFQCPPFEATGLVSGVRLGTFIGEVTGDAICDREIPVTRRTGALVTAGWPDLTGVLEVKSESPIRLVGWK